MAGGRLQAPEPPSAQACCSQSPVPRTSEVDVGWGLFGQFGFGMSPAEEAWPTEASPALGAASVFAPLGVMTSCGLLPFLLLSAHFPKSNRPKSQTETAHLLTSFSLLCSLLCSSFSKPDAGGGPLGPGRRPPALPSCPFGPSHSSFLQDTGLS